MPLTQFAFGTAPSDQDPPLLDSRNATVETITPSGSTAATTATAPAGNGRRAPICRVSTDTAIYISFGTAPNAGTDTSRFYMPANSTEYFYVRPSDKGAVITA